MTRMTMWLTGVLAAAMLAGCGEAATYSAADELAAALTAGEVSCARLQDEPTGSLVRSQATCTSQRGALALYVFEGAPERDNWLRVGAQLGAVAVGPNWVVTGEPADTEAAAAALNGRFESAE